MIIKYITMANTDNDITNQAEKGKKLKSFSPSIISHINQIISLVSDMILIYEKSDAIHPKWISTDTYPSDADNCNDIFTNINYFISSHKTEFDINASNDDEYSKILYGKKNTPNAIFTRGLWHIAKYIKCNMMPNNTISKNITKTQEHFINAFSVFMILSKPMTYDEFVIMNKLETSKPDTNIYEYLVSQTFYDRIKNDICNLTQTIKMSAIMFSINKGDIQILLEQNIKTKFNKPVIITIQELCNTQKDNHKKDKPNDTIPETGNMNTKQNTVNIIQKDMNLNEIIGRSNKQNHTSNYEYDNARNSKKYNTTNNYSNHNHNTNSYMNKWKTARM